MSRVRKLDPKWLGPYRISNRPSQADRGTYRLEDLDGSLFRHTTPGWRLKLFIQRTPEDIAEEDRGTSKLASLSQWEKTHHFQEPPAHLDESQEQEPLTPSGSHEPRRSARQLQANRPRIVQVKPRVLTPEERAAYEMPVENSSESEGSDSDEA
jgi:hypothetical protein